MEQKLNYLLNNLAKGLDSEHDKGRLEQLASQCYMKASIIANNTKNNKLKNDYLKAVRSINSESRHRNSDYDDINVWGRIVLNTLRNTFPHRF